MRGHGCAAPPVLGLLLLLFSRPSRAGLTYAAPPALVFFCGGTILNDREYAEKERGGACGFVLR